MSLVGTLDSAREKLLLPADMPAGEVLEAARARVAELRSRTANPKAPAVARQAALRKLKELEPLLPWLEIEVELDVLETTSNTPGPHIHRLRLEAKRLAERLEKLAESDERTIARERLAVVQERLRASPIRTDDHDPAAEALEKKIAALREALARNDTNPVRLAALLAEAHGVASVLREGPVRDAANADLETLARTVEERLTPPAPPPPPPAPPPPVVPAMPAPVAPVEKKPEDQRQPDRGRVLRLSPQVNPQFTGPLPSTLRFVTGNRFVLGREETEQSSRADFLTPTHFKNVSRMHATLLREGAEIKIEDGAGETRSLNGTRLDEQQLTTQVTLNLAKEHTVTLGQVFTVRLRHAATEAPASQATADKAKVKASNGSPPSPPSLNGAISFVPKDDVPQLVVSVWLFTDATIGANPSCAVPLTHVGLVDRQARVHIREESFWIENLRSGSAVRVGEHVVAKGERWALHQGDILHLGQLTFEVFVES